MVRHPKLHFGRLDTWSIERKEVFNRSEFIKRYRYVFTGLGGRNTEKCQKLNFK